VINTLQTQTQN